MTYKLEFENYPQMTRFFEKECGYTVEEIEQIAMKRLLPQMKARIYLANDFIKEIVKWGGLNMWLYQVITIALIIAISFYTICIIVERLFNEIIAFLVFPFIALLLIIIA